MTSVLVSVFPKQAKWPAAPVLWTIYRSFLAVYLIVWLILILVIWGEPPYYSQADSKVKWLIYVSNWSFLLQISYLVTMAVGNIYYHATHGWRNARGERSNNHFRQCKLGISCPSRRKFCKYCMLSAFPSPYDEKK